jgi:Domain of unknown function (DUF1854)
MTQQLAGEPSSPYHSAPASAPLPAPASSQATLSLEKRHDGRLWALLAERAAPVKLRRCFPWTFPERYISLQSDDNTELAFVSDPKELSAASQAALSQALSEAGFVFLIQRVHSVEEDFELRCFKVETPQGPRAFQTALDAWPRETPDGGLLIEDVAGDVFRIEDPGALDPRSRELLWELVD